MGYRYPYSLDQITQTADQITIRDSSLVSGAGALFSTDVRDVVFGHRLSTITRDVQLILESIGATSSDLSPTELFRLEATLMGYPQNLGSTNIEDGIRSKYGIKVLKALLEDTTVGETTKTSWSDTLDGIYKRLKVS